MPPLHPLEKSDLDRELKELGARYPRLDRPDLFVAWFLRAYVSDKDEAALNALTGPNREKGIDALLIDDSTDLVTIVQGKLRAIIMGNTEKAEDVVTFARLAVELSGPDHEFRAFVRQLEPLAAGKVRAARKRLLEKNYRLNLHYVTLGRCSANVVSQARAVARSAGVTLEHAPELRVFDGQDVLGVLDDYLDGVAPPVPSLLLEAAGEVAYQHDKSSGIESWVFSMQGSKVARLLDGVGEKLFARNIRGYLGESRINKAMRTTLRRDPASFLFLNNGITVICDAANPGQSGGLHLLEVFNPQIINGQQTTYALHDAGPAASKAKVFVRVVGVKKGAAAKGVRDYEKMVSAIVEATNSQNTIKPSDLRSNDRIQVRLQRDFRKLDYFYVRKTGRAQEWDLAAQHRWRVKKEEVARAVMACSSAATLLNEGVQSLFEDPAYSEVFRHTAKHLLCRWWLMKTVAGVARGSGERQAGKFLAMQFIWSDLGSDIETHEDCFLAGCQASMPDRRVRELERVCKHAMSGVVQHYQQDRGRGTARLEVNPFFKRRDRYEEFVRFWRSRRSSHKINFTKAANDFRAALELG